MTLYIAVDGVNPEALDAADDELLSQTVHQLLHEELNMEGIKTVDIVKDLETEVDEAVISKESLQVLANGTARTLDSLDLDPTYQATLSDALDEANNALYDQ